MSSRIYGVILDIEDIVKAARLVKIDFYIICDAVQYAPQGLIDLEKNHQLVQ